MSLDRNATLTGPDAVDFDAASSRPLAVFAVEPRKNLERKAHAVEGLVRTTPFASLTATRLAEVAAAASLPASDRAAATEAAARLREAEDAAKAAAQAKADIAEVEKDLQRLREHMKAVAGEHGGAGGGGANPFAGRVLAAEDRLTALRKKVGRLRGRRQGEERGGGGGAREAGDQARVTARLLRYTRPSCARGSSSPSSPSCRPWSRAAARRRLRP